MLFYKNGNEMERAYHNKGGKFWFHITTNKGGQDYIVAADSKEEALEHLKINVLNFIKARRSYKEYSGICGIEYDLARAKGVLQSLKSKDYVAEKLDINCAYPVSYFDDSRSN